MSTVSVWHGTMRLTCTPRRYDDAMSLNYLHGIRAVVFDAVGTILEPNPTPADVYAQIGGRHGSKLPQSFIASAFREAFNAQERRDVTLRLVTDEARECERWRSIVGAVLHDVVPAGECFQELWNHFRQPANWKLTPDTGRVFTALRERGLKLAVASNFDSRLRSVLAGFVENQQLDDVVISSEVGWRKPAPQFFAAVCQRLACDPSHILFVGDSRENDYDGAIAAGMSALLLDAAGRHAQTDSRRIGSLMELVEN